MAYAVTARMQAAIAKKYCAEQLPGSLAALEALLKLNKNGDGFLVGDEVSKTSRFSLLFAS